MLNDFKCWLSAWLLSWSIAEIDLVVKCMLGLPGAIYLCLKIYHDYLKKENKDAKS